MRREQGEREAERTCSTAPSVQYKPGRSEGGNQKGKERMNEAKLDDHHRVRCEQTNAKNKCLVRPEHTHTHTALCDITIRQQQQVAQICTLMRAHD